MDNMTFYKNLRRPETIFLLEQLRRAAIRIISIAIIFSIGGYYCAEPVLKYLQYLTGIKLVSYGLPDIFFSFVKLALALAFAAVMPHGFYTLLAIIPAYYPDFSRRRLLCFWLAAVILFIAGGAFCIEISLPYGIQFLLSFGGAHLSDAISVKKFISFCLLMIFGFGLIFELPLIMILLARIGLARADPLAAYRRFAILAIFVVAAVITPTPDIFNLLLMAVPLYLLFEIGLLGMRFI